MNVVFKGEHYFNNLKENKFINIKMIIMKGINFINWH
jgi:hypothetical protein